MKMALNVHLHVLNSYGTQSKIIKDDKERLSVKIHVKV